MSAASAGYAVEGMNATALQLAQQSILTGSYSPPVAQQGIVFQSPPLGGVNPGLDGSATYQAPVANGSYSFGSYLNPSTTDQQNLTTAGSVPQSTIPAPSTSDGSFLGKVGNFFTAAASDIADATTSIYNDTIGPQTVLGNLPTAVVQTVGSDAQAAGTGISTGISAVGTGIEDAGSAVVGGAKTVLTGLAISELFVVGVVIAVLYIAVNGKHPLPGSIG